MTHTTYKPQTTRNNQPLYTHCNVCGYQGPSNIGDGPKARFLAYFFVLFGSNQSCWNGFILITLYLSNYRDTSFYMMSLQAYSVTQRIWYMISYERLMYSRWIGMSVNVSSQFVLLFVKVNMALTLYVDF